MGVREADNLGRVASTQRDRDSHNVTVICLVDVVDPHGLDVVASPRLIATCPFCEFGSRLINQGPGRRSMEESNLLFREAISWSLADQDRNQQNQ